MRPVPDEVRQTLRPYLAEVTRLFGSVLEAVVLYGSAAGGEYVSGRSNINLLLVLAKHDNELLLRYSKLHRRWQKENIVVPLFFTTAELRDSLKLFPLEYLEMKDQHVLLVGRDPFLELHIDTTHVPLQCIQEIRGNLFRLRQRYVEGRGRPDAIALLLPLSLTAVLACLRGLFKVSGRSYQESTEGLLQELQPGLGIDPSVFLEVLNLKRGHISPGALELPRLFSRYMSALETLGDKVTQGQFQHE